MNCVIQPYTRLQKEVGTQDLLKFIALLTMVIDHFGMFFFSEEPFFRVIGRSSAIIWFFFLGFNYKETNFFNQLFYCTIIFTPISYFFANKLFPLNILFSMMISRIALKYYNRLLSKLASDREFEGGSERRNAVYMDVHEDSSTEPTYKLPTEVEFRKKSNKYVKFNLYAWFYLSFTFFFLFLLTNIMFEYGTLGILISIWGYNLKHHKDNLAIQAVTISLITSICEIYIFHFNVFNAVTCFFIINMTIYSLYRFKPIILNIQGIWRYIINFCARYSLYLYCLHFLLLLYIRTKL